MKILDIGANDGFWYLQNKSKYPLCEFTLIDANPYNEPKLKSLGVEYYIKCLSDSEKEIDFYTNKNDLSSTGASYYKENTNHFSDDNLEILKVKTTTLQNLFENRFFDIIKIDVQGAELDIIKGGIEIFRNSKKVIIELPVDGIEYNIGAPKRSEYFNTMKELGFNKFYSIENIGGVHEDFIFEK